MSASNNTKGHDDSIDKVDVSDCGVESVSSDVSSSEENEERSFIILPKKKESPGEISCANTKPDSSPKVVVQVQLPPHFSTGGGSRDAANDENPAVQELASLTSEASSFIPIRTFGKLSMCQNLDNNDVNGTGIVVTNADAELVPKVKGQEADKGNMKFRSQEFKLPLQAVAKDDKSEASDWSVVSSFQQEKGETDDRSIAASAKNDDDKSVAASSTISGFDLISLKGSSHQKKCPRCSFQNEDKDMICQVCTLALVANPSVVADELLARTLQQQEEKDAFRAAISQQKKRSSLGKEPILYRAQTLANDILSVLEACRLTHGDTDKVGFCALPNSCLTVLASRFIDRVDEMTDPFKEYVSPVTLCYCYSGKDAQTMCRIRQDGFGPGARFGSTPEAALKAFNKYGHGRSRYGLTLETIQEQEGLDSSHHAPAIQGWIVAIVSGGRSSEISVRSGRAMVYAQTRSVESLPLVSFDATLFETDTIRCLLNGLSTACRDFFRDCALSGGAVTSCESNQPDQPSGDMKRRRVDTESHPKNHNEENTETDEDGIALALQDLSTEDDIIDLFLNQCTSSVPPPPPPPPQMSLPQPNPFRSEPPSFALALQDLSTEDDIIDLFLNQCASSVPPPPPPPPPQMSLPQPNPFRSEPPSFARPPRPLQLPLTQVSSPAHGNSILTTSNDCELLFCDGDVEAGLCDWNDGPYPL